jgi:hypothetical protein
VHQRDDRGRRGAADQALSCSSEWKGGLGRLSEFYERLLHRGTKGCNGSGTVLHFTTMSGGSMTDTALMPEWQLRY